MGVLLRTSVHILMVFLGPRGSLLAGFMPVVSARLISASSRQEALSSAPRDISIPLAPIRHLRMNKPLDVRRGGYNALIREAYSRDTMDPRPSQTVGFGGV